VNQESLKYLLALATVSDVGPLRFRSLLGHFRGAREVFEAPQRELAELPQIGPKTAQQIKSFDRWDFVEKQLSWSDEIGAKFLSFDDGFYPANLKNIPDAPPLLYMRGEVLPQDEKAIAVVGSRTFTNYGRKATEKIVGHLAELGVTIISGLARGIDSCAHRSALQAGGRTIAVFGCGLDRVYPTENGKLALEILSSGAWLSEFPLGTEPVGVNFPRRNRLISGLSLGVVVVEAGEKSGALLTAGEALEQNREVFAVPGDITKATSRGTNSLIKQGAKLVTGLEDILEELKGLGIKSRERKAQDERQLSLPPEERKLYDSLGETPLHIDELAETLERKTSEVLATLLGLELKGLVRQLPGKRFIRE
jgi:DNA processing protein